MAKIEFRGAVLEYQESGESGEKRAAESLVFVHGSASDYRTWDKQAEFFGHEYRVLAYSRRFHWPNQEPTSSCVYSMSEHMHDLDALLHRLEIAPAHLVGHSYGAFVCLLLAMQRPHLVRSLVLIEPPVLSLFVSDPPTPMEVAKLFPKNPTSALSILSFVLKGVAPATLAFRSGALERGAEIFGRATLGKEAFEHLSEERRSQMRDNLPALKAEMEGSGLPPLNLEEMERASVPTLLLTGERSRPLFRHLADGIEDAFPHVCREEIKGGGHLMHEDSPDEFNRVVLSFLSTLPSYCHR